MIRFPWFASYWADRFHFDGFGVDQTRGTMAACQERGPIIGGNVGMREHNEILLFKAPLYLFEQDAVLETSTDRATVLKRGAPSQVSPQASFVAIVTMIFARPTWNRAAITGTGVLISRSRRIARHIPKGQYKQSLSVPDHESRGISEVVADASQGVRIDGRLQPRTRFTLVSLLFSADAQNRGDGIEQPAAGRRLRRIDGITDHRIENGTWPAARSAKTSR